MKTNQHRIYPLILLLFLTACSSKNVAGTSIQPETIEASTHVLETTEESTEETPDLHPYDFTFCFAGDISLADDAVTMNKLEENNGDLSACISPELIELLRNADISVVNNEFCFSDRGQPMAGKAYTFRASPDKISIWEELGVDVAGLANNHVFDYGQDAFEDMLTLLSENDVKYVGAGRNIEEAAKPLYFDFNGKTVALVAASRAEKYKLTPEAGEDTPGIFRCYDPTLFMEKIQEADENADFVIANVHWGTEYSTELETAQIETGKQYLEAGADVIIGGHTHCLQGMEYYDGKPILYSLGNFWFNNKTLDTMLVSLHFYGDDLSENMDVILTPAIQTGARVILADEVEKDRIFNMLTGLSNGVGIEDTGVLYAVD